MFRQSNMTYSPTTQQNWSLNNDSNISSTKILLASHIHNETVFEHYPPALLCFGAICCIVFAIVGIVGNFVSILALSRCPRLKNATTIFIINLCVADLLFCSFSLPLSAVTFLEKGWRYGENLCQLFPLFRYTNGAVSLFSVMAITINRYILVVHPRHYPKVYKNWKIGLSIGVIWVAAGILLAPTLFKAWGKFGYDPKVGTCTILPYRGKSPKMFLYITAFGLPSIVFVFCYSRIFWVVRKASTKLQKDQRRSIASSNTVTFTSSHMGLKKSHRHSEMPKQEDMPKRDRKELRVLRVMMVIFITFLLCYFPVSFVKIFRKEDDLPVLNIMGYLAVYFSNCVNPIIYVVMSQDYRTAYLELFRRKSRKNSAYS